MKPCDRYFMSTCLASIDTTKRSRHAWLMELVENAAITVLKEIGILVRRHCCSLLFPAHAP